MLSKNGDFVNRQSPQTSSRVATRWLVDKLFLCIYYAYNDDLMITKSSSQAGLALHSRRETPMNHANQTLENQADRPQGQVIEVLDEYFNARSARINDDRVTGRQIAEAAGYNSIDEVIVLQQLISGALEELRPEELVDLAQPGVERFFVIEGDATFRFLLDGLKFEWPRAKVSAITLLRIARKDDEFEVVQQLEDAPDKVLDDGDVVDLTYKGTEQFKTRKVSKLITVLYNEQLFELPKGTYASEQLIAIFKVDPGYLLDFWVEGKLVELKPGQEIKLKAGMHFMSHPPRGQSS